MCQINLPWRKLDINVHFTLNRGSANNKVGVSDILRGRKSSFLEEEPETKRVKVEASVPEPEIEKGNVQPRVPESNSLVFNLSNCSVVFKM